MALKFGVDDEDLAMIIRQGVFIYNTIDNRILYDEDNDVSGFFIKENLIIVGKYPNQNDKIQLKDRIYEIYDFENKKMYSREFSRFERENIVEINNMGFILKNQDGSITYLYFDKHFNMKEL